VSNILEEVKKILGKGAIELVPPGQEGQGFYSTFFIVPKKILDATLPLLFSTPRDRKLPASICRQNSVHDTLPGFDPGLTVHNLLIFRKARVFTAPFSLF
jgi:hypothetical protein